MPYRVRGERKIVSFDILHANQWNPNQMDERRKEALRESLEEHGMVDDLLVRPHPEFEGEYEVIDGEHRYRAIVEFAAEVGAMVPVNVIDASDDEAKKLTIIMNETRGSADKVDLAKLLAELNVNMGEDLITGLPYSENELQELIDLAGAEWGDYGDSWEDEGDEDPQPNGWVNFEAVMTVEDFEAFKQAEKDIEEVSGDLSSDEAVRRGQIIAALTAEYLGSVSSE